VREVIHGVNLMRKELGYDITDRVVLKLRPGDEELLRYVDWIKRETLSVDVRIEELPPAFRMAIEKADETDSLN
jgi:hypothetical protein